MTWAEFVKKMEAAGVQPDTVVRYIDVNGNDDFDVLLVPMPGGNTEVEAW